MNLPDALAKIAAMDAALEAQRAVPPTGFIGPLVEHIRAAMKCQNANAAASQACIAYVRTLAQPDRDAHLTDETVSAVSDDEAARIREAAKPVEGVQVDDAKDAARYRKALEDISKRMEVIGPRFLHLSAVYRIATDALAHKAGR